MKPIQEDKISEEIGLCRTGEGEVQSYLFFQ